MSRLSLWRSQPSNRVRSRSKRHFEGFEALESRISLTNGLVGVPGQINTPRHNVVVSSVPEDPGNTGIVPSTAVTIIGSVANPAGGPISSFHTTLTINAIESGTTIGSVSWNVTTGPGTITGPSYFGQDPSHQNTALFSIPITLLSSAPGVQNVTFQIVAAGFGSRDVVQQANTSQKLTGTFQVNGAPAGPTVSSISPVNSPRTDPVASVDATFSTTIDPTTFTTSDITLTRDGSPVVLGNDVTLTSTDNKTFTIGGLTSYTTPFGSYQLTVSASGVKDTNGNTGSGSQSVDFLVQSADAPPIVLPITPIPSPREKPVFSVDVSFSKVINQSTFTVEDLQLTRDTEIIPLGGDVIFNTFDDQTFTISGLESYTAAAGNYVLRVSAAGVTDTNGVPGKGSQTVSFLVQPPAVDTGPRVVGLHRFGLHNQPAMLVLTYDRPMDTDTVVLLNNYLVYNPGRDHKLGTADDVIVPISSGYYDSANKTITLVMAKSLYISKLHRIVVNGTGPNAVKDQNGVALDGAGNGTPGTDFTTTFGREIVTGLASPTGATTTATKINVKARGARRFVSYKIGS